MEQLADLIPGLPDDIACECLARIPYLHLPSARSVSSLWKKELDSPAFHRLRSSRKLTTTAIILAQSATPFTFTSYRLVLHDPATSTYTTLPSIPGGLPLFSRIAPAGRKLVVLGGWNPDTLAAAGDVHVFNFVTGTWRQGAAMPGAHRAFFACSPAAAGSRPAVLVAGGKEELTSTADTLAYEYDVESDVWSPMPGCEGVTGGDVSESVEALDVVRWKREEVVVEEEEDVVMDSLRYPGNCIARAGGKVYMCGDGGVAVREGGRWRLVAELPEEVAAETQMVGWEGKVMVVGSGKSSVGMAGYVLEVEGGEGAVWRKVVVPEEYSGHVQAACCVEI